MKVISVCLIVGVGTTFLMCFTAAKDALRTSINRLEKQLKEISEETEKYEQENKQLSTRIDAVAEEFERKMAGFKLEKFNITADTKKVMEEMKTVQIELSGLYKRENELMLLLEKLQKENKKFKLSARWLKQDMHVYHTRRNDSDDQACYTLDDTASTNITQKTFDRRSNEELIIVLKSELEQGQSELLRARLENSQLRHKLNDSVSFWVHQVSNLEAAVEATVEGITQARAGLKTLQEKRKITAENIVKVTTDIRNTRDEIRQSKLALKEMKTNLADHEKAISCYQNIQKHTLIHSHDITK